MQKQSNFSIYRQGFKRKWPFSLLSIVFILFSLLCIPALFFLEGSIKAPFEKYNYEAILSAGKEKNAVIKSIITNNNVTVNDVHPKIITYQYNNEQAVVSDKFQTMDVDDINNLNSNDSVKISVLNGESVIKGAKPYSFPFKIFWILPTIFLLIGIPFFFIAHFAGMRNIRRNNLAV